MAITAQVSPVVMEENDSSTPPPRAERGPDEEGRECETIVQSGGLDVQEEDIVFLHKLSWRLLPFGNDWLSSHFDLDGPPAAGWQFAALESRSLRAPGRVRCGCACHRWALPRIRK